MIRDKLPLPSSNSPQPSDDDTETEEGEVEERETRSFQITVEPKISDDEPATIPDIHQTLVTPADITEKPAAVRRRT